MEGYIKRLMKMHREDIKESSSRSHDQLYHLSHPKYHASIMKEGLRAPVYMTWDYGYMIAMDPEIANRVIDKDSIDLYVVNTSNYSLLKDREWDDGGSDEDYQEYDPNYPDQEIIAYICRENIPTQDIKYLGKIRVTSKDIGFRRVLQTTPPAEDLGLDHCYF